MMGRGHAQSGLAVSVAGTAALALTGTLQMEPVPLIIACIVFTGASLGPDLDSYTATVTKSFGIVGRILYYITNFISLAVYNLTRSRRDDARTNGHRTFTHTLIGAILMGLGVFGLTSLPGEVEIAGNMFSWGQVATLVLVAFFLHLGVAGLFSSKLKKLELKVGPYLIMLGALATAFLISMFLPDMSYQWLAFAVTGGFITHQLGDMITKAGVPLVWPIPIRGKRWYDVSLPGPLRIEAGGVFERKILEPIFFALTGLGLVAHFLIALGIIGPGAGA